MHKIYRKANNILNLIQMNLKGRSLNKKYLIIESDDWGAVRTPSRKFNRVMELQGVDIKNYNYRNDALASNDDIEILFEVLSSFRDEKNNPLKFTANTIVANPDFHSIVNNNYEYYRYEPLAKSFARYPKHSKVIELWKEGMSHSIWRPQLHGREHLNVNRWMDALRKDLFRTRQTAILGSTYSGEGDYSFMEALDYNEEREVISHEKIIIEAQELFKELFGFNSKSFMAPCHNWAKSHEKFLSENGIDIIQGGNLMKIPTGKFGQYQTIKNSFGEKNDFEQMYNIRNVTFEPAFNLNKDWVSSALYQIRLAFMLNMPAVISSHRINYVGYIDSENRDRSIKLLKELITQVLKKWPDVMFISTDELKDYV